MRTRVAAAFAAVYIIWGSTYLAIRFVIETIPPFFMAGTRFIIAGAVLYLLAGLRNAPKATAPQWGRAAIVGGLMLLGGHGAVIWAEQWMPSGITSLLVATVPLWMALLNGLGTHKKPDLKVALGLIVGFVGVGLLIGNLNVSGGTHATVSGGALVVIGALFWASGSLYSRSSRIRLSPMQATAMEMLAGGAILLVASLFTGEWFRLRFDQVSIRSFGSWLYLIFFGSLIGFTSYMWLLKVTTPERVSTYAYVNPVVALLLGWTLASESLTMLNMVAAGIVLASVAAITVYGARSSH